MRDVAENLETGGPGPAELVALEALAMDLALGAGRLVHEERPVDLALGTKSSATDVVTEMDALAEQYLRDRLALERPDDPVYGEEQAPRAGTGTVTWVLDPIDGTVNYLYGSDEYAVSVAAVLGDPDVPGAWVPVAGAVHQPARSRTYHARRGGGARCVAAAGEGTELRVSACTDVGLALLGTGFGYRAEVRREQARALVGLLPRVRDIRRGGSAALDLCSVAAGRLDAYYERGVNAWDIAAGWLVVTEAGGLVTGVGADRPDPAGTLAAPPALHAGLRAAVTESLD